MPWTPGKEPAKHPAYLRISEAARVLNEQRERWLNPPEWIEPLARSIDKLDDFADVPGDIRDPGSARALIRHSAIMAAAAKDPRLKRRTLTNLYNERPAWLRHAHEQLDRAVLAAYAATDRPHLAPASLRPDPLPGGRGGGATVRSARGAALVRRLGASLDGDRRRATAPRRPRARRAAQGD